MDTIWWIDLTNSSLQYFFNHCILLIFENLKFNQVLKAVKICLHSWSIELYLIRCLLDFLYNEVFEFFQLIIAHLVSLSYAWENIFYNWCWESFILHYFHLYIIVWCCAFILINFFLLRWVNDVKYKGGTSFKSWSFV